MVLAVACSVGQSSESRRPAGSAVASAAPSLPPQVTQLATWQRCGATQVPPADVLKIPTQLPKVINRTNGAVSDADAQKWVTAFMREQGIELWALTSDQPGLLQNGCLGSRASNLHLFGSELAYMETARASNRKLVVEVAQRPSVAVVALTPEDATNIKGFDGTPTAFGLVIEIQGPGGTYATDASGNRTALAIIKPTDHFFRMEGGEYRDGEIGPIWFQGSAISCSAAWLRRTCGI
jgi:hypothetical protein